MTYLNDRAARFVHIVTANSTDNFIRGTFEVQFYLYMCLYCQNTTVRVYKLCIVLGLCTEIVTLIKLLCSRRIQQVRLSHSRNHLRGCWRVQWLNDWLNCHRHFVLSAYEMKFLFGYCGRVPSSSRCGLLRRAKFGAGMRDNSCTKQSLAVT